MPGLWQQFRSWWNKDALAKAEGEARMTQAERDVSREDYEGRKDDVLTSGETLAGGTADYERDSESPRNPPP